MRRERVVITGTGVVSAFGAGLDACMNGLFAGQSAVRAWSAPEHIRGLDCRVVAAVPALPPPSLPRDLRRGMSAMSHFAWLAAEETLAGLDAEARRSTGVAIGSTLGSPATLQLFFDEFLQSHDVSGIRSMVFFKVMGNTVASNISMACGCCGRQVAPCAACASGLQALGLGFEAIAAGRETRMLCGGADELHLLTLAAFDRLGAASHHADPLTASRPFDTHRNGIVCGEGAGLLLLENLEIARARNATIQGEIIGFATNSSFSGLAYPDADSVRLCMAAALDDAGLVPDKVTYINAHATSTEAGDMAEGTAIAQLFGASVPVSSLKGLLGHSLAASGPIETAACLSMWQRGLCLPTANLVNPDPRCGTLGHVIEPMPMPYGPVLKNSFGLGGCNASLLIQPYQEK